MIMNTRDHKYLIALISYFNSKGMFPNRDVIYNNYRIGEWFRRLKSLEDNDVDDQILLELEKVSKDWRVNPSNKIMSEEAKSVYEFIKNNGACTCQEISNHLKLDLLECQKVLKALIKDKKVRQFTFKELTYFNHSV